MMKLPQAPGEVAPLSFPFPRTNLSDLFSHLLLCHLLLDVSYFTRVSDIPCSQGHFPTVRSFKMVVWLPTPEQQLQPGGWPATPQPPSRPHQRLGQAPHPQPPVFTFSALLSWPWKRACCTASRQRPRLLTLHTRALRLQLSCSKSRSCSC